MNKLILNIKKQYFEQIVKGLKNEEYRIFKPFWITRIIGKQYSHVVFKNGYGLKSVFWDVNVWLVSGDSMLTQYTYWTSFDAINWTPRNNGIQGLAFAIG